MIGERRAAELDAAMGKWLGDGGSLLFVTATLQHSLGDELHELLDMLQASWSRTWRWQKGKRPTWYRGQARAVELTHGANGWHPHVHACIFVEPGHDLENVRHEVEAMAARWQESVTKNGGRTRITPTRDKRTGQVRVPGWDVRKVTEAGALASYLTKVDGGWSAGHELARSDLKSGHGRTPWQLLDDAIAGDFRSEKLFLMYEAATSGRRRVVTSPGLLRDLGVDEISDEDAAVCEAEGDPIVTVMIPEDDWRRLMSARFIGQLMDDVDALARGDSDGWPWPAEWLVTAPSG